MSGTPNPMAMMQMAKRFQIFSQEHPRVMPFFQMANATAIKEGAVIEMKVTSPEGKELVTNIKLTKDDIETIQMLKSLKG